MRTGFASLGLALGMAAASTAVNAAPVLYNFYQDGWTGGGMLTMSVTLDTSVSLFAPNWVSKGIGGVSDAGFSFSFTGNAVVPDFSTTDYAKLISFSWTHTNSTLGTVASFPPDGVFVSDSAFVLFQGPFSGKTCDGVNVGADIFAGPAWITTSNVMQLGLPPVQNVPEPASAGLALLGLAALAATATRRLRSPRPVRG